MLDHWLIYHAHYEMGSIYQRKEDWARAAGHYEVVMSGQSILRLLHVYKLS